MISGTVVLSRDHHDVSGTDSPFRETSALKDGSKFTADMAVHNFVGDAIRGATLVALHNGGGTGWGEVKILHFIAIYNNFTKILAIYYYLDFLPFIFRRLMEDSCWF